MIRLVLQCSVVLALISMYWAPHVGACSCLWAGPFREMAAQSELVVQGKVRSYGKRLSHGDDLYGSMQVEIVRVIKGKYTARTITILGDRGADCRPYITPQTFAKNKEYLFALYEQDEKRQPISGCGEYWIAIESGMAMGHDRAPVGDTGGSEMRAYSVRVDALVEQIARDAEGEGVE